MLNLHCWNDFDPLKTVILGSVFDNNKVPLRYNDARQDFLVKIVEESNVELNNYQTILQQNGVKVLRPKQPSTYNGQILPDHDPLINMRDFFITYGNIFFTTYGPYSERRFQHAWLEDIFHQINLNGNLIVNAPEVNLDDSDLNWNSFLDDSEYFNLVGENVPSNLKQAKNDWFKKNYENLPFWDFFEKHNLLNRKKFLFHTAWVLKRNNKAYIAKYGELSVGHRWFENWLRHIGVTPVYIPKVGHIDNSAIFLNNDTMFINPDRWQYNNPSVESYFDDVKNFIYLSASLPKEVQFDLFNEVFNPQLWYTKWKDYCLDYQDNVNCLVINPNKVLLCFYDKDFYAKLKNIGIEAIYVKWSHAKFWEGNIHCITCELERSY